MGTDRQHEEVPSDRGTPARPGVARPWSDRATSAEAVLNVQRTAGNRAVLRMLRRKEVAAANLITGAQDWTSADRTQNTSRWQAACLTNLNAGDSGQYRRIVQRRDFYKWFYDYTMARGYTTRWPLAAWVVANGAHQIADMNEQHSMANYDLDLAGPELQGYMREGNQVIFENVLPKLKRLLDGGPITGRTALQWDMQTLAEEQTLVQPMYSRMSQHAFDQLDYIAHKTRFAGWGAWWSDEDLVADQPNVHGGRVPGFDQHDLRSISDRWHYGMNLGNRFTPGGSGFNAATDALPSVDASYTGGAEFARVDWRSHLHFIDAWLGTHNARSGIPALISALGSMNDREKGEMLADSSPEGWAYSTELAPWKQFGVTETIVRGALPSDAASAPAVETFVATFNHEATRYGTPVGIPRYRR